VVYSKAGHVSALVRSFRRGPGAAYFRDCKEQAKTTMAVYQLQLPLIITSDIPPVPTRDRLAALLGEDLDFHDRHSGYASHNFHSFPAKFPPQLPRKFIDALTRQGDIVLDPMVGSGTTVVEAYLTGRQGVGFDIDPLAIMISKVKATPLDLVCAAEAGKRVLRQAAIAISERRSQLEEALEGRWDAETREFVDYWFAHEAIAFDLAHARPHRAKLVTTGESKSLPNTLQGVCHHGCTHTAC
jgi:hypothetical protein